MSNRKDIEVAAEMLMKKVSKISGRAVVAVGVSPLLRLNGAQATGLIVYVKKIVTPSPFPKTCGGWPVFQARMGDMRPANL